MNTFQPNIKLKKEVELSNWRKASLIIWPDIHEAQFRTIENFKAPVLPAGVTPFHFFLKALAVSFKTHPNMNAVVLGKKIYEREEITFFFHIAKENGELDGSTLRNVDQLSVQDIAAAVKSMVKEVNSETKITDKPMPFWVIRIWIWLMHFICFRLNLWTPNIGLPRDKYGCAMVSNIGKFGVGPFLSARTNYCYNAVTISLGPITDKWPVYFAFDHRLCDGLDAAKFIKTLQECFNNPERILL